MRLRRTMLLAAVSCVAVAAMAMTAVAQPPGGRGPGGRGSRGRGPGGSSSGGSLLLNESVQKELELVPDQVDKLRKLSDTARERMREVFSGLRDLSSEEREAKRDEIRQKFIKVREDIQSETKKILLPRQADRWNQIQTQMRMRGGTERALGSEELVKKLGITDEQKEKIQKVASETQEELRQEMDRLRKEAREKILGVLTSKQRKQLESMIGEPFEFQRSEDRGPQRGGGRPGGERSRPRSEN